MAPRSLKMAPTTAALASVVVVVVVVLASRAPPCVAVANKATGTGTGPGSERASMLSNGLMFPLLGFGTSSGVQRRHVHDALDAGARLLDTAQAHEW